MGIVWWVQGASLDTQEVEEDGGVDQAWRLTLSSQMGAHKG